MNGIYTLYRTILVYVALCATSIALADNSDIQASITADLLIFSYDRPLQLYALLESATYNMQGLASCHVIYRASTDDYDQAYQTVQNCFKNVQLHKQQGTPEQTFKQMLVAIAFQQTSSDYVIFGVDDIIVTHPIIIADCIAHLEKNNAYGFFLRMGNNINQSYIFNQKKPQLVGAGPSVLKWQFSQGTGDWAYANNVDMTLYRKKDIKKAFDDMNFKTPNTLDIAWNSGKQREATMHLHGLCYETSKIVNIPLNAVQEYKKHAKHMNAYTTDQLLAMFNQGLIIDVKKLFLLTHPGAHHPYKIDFINHHPV